MFEQKTMPFPYLGYYAIYGHSSSNGVEECRGHPQLGTCRTHLPSGWGADPLETHHSPDGLLNLLCWI